MRVLGIETSCDETAAAVVSDQGRVESDVVHSQVKLHAPYGGVVPELASRDHVRNFGPWSSTALERAGLSLEAIDGIAVTCRPGLSGALLVGVALGKGLAWATRKPIVGVDHLVGHLLAVFLSYPDLPEPVPPEFPFVALLASGGHTALYRVEGPALSAVRELGATRDDAAGEAFDKVAKLLGLGYPGGPIVDRLAEQGDPLGDRATASDAATRFARVQLLRTQDQRRALGQRARSARRRARPREPVRGVSAAGRGDARRKDDHAAARPKRVRTVVLAGGVAANRELRARASVALGSPRPARWSFRRFAPAPTTRP